MAKGGYIISRFFVSYTPAAVPVLHPEYDGALHFTRTITVAKTGRKNYIKIKVYSYDLKTV
jgi:hypothetical protein